MIETKTGVLSMFLPCIGTARVSFFGIWPLQPHQLKRYQYISVTVRHRGVIVHHLIIRQEFRYDRGRLFDI